MLLARSIALDGFVQNWDGVKGDEEGLKNSVRIWGDVIAMRIKNTTRTAVTILVA